MGSKQPYTPHLKKVLKSYQAAATTSLHGPNSFMGTWPAAEESAAVMPPDPARSVTSGSPKPRSPKDGGAPKKQQEEYDPFAAPPPFPIQQPPLFTPADQGRCEKSETILESETISCFSVGGERRLCLPQILNTVLRDFSLQQINCVCDNLHIFCSRCNAEQLEVLKATGVLPLSAPSCGLITKTDAERLCAALLDGNPPRVVPNPDAKLPFQVRVYHECFGRCTGLYTPDLYVEPRARCIECVECHGLLSPQKFVCHAHHPKENRTCHWGFDSFHWRAYILLEIGLEENVQLKEVLKEMKMRFDYKYNKRKQVLVESCDPSTKKVRVESYCPYPYALDPTLVYWYPNPMWNKVTAFKPMTPVITKDGKPIYIPPEALPTFFKDGFENDYQPKIALSPADVQKLGLLQVSSDQTTAITYNVHKTETISKKEYFKKEHDYDSNPCCFDSEDTFSDTSFSTLSEKRKSRELDCVGKIQSSSGTEDDLVSNLEEEDELQPSMESELHELNKLLTINDVDASLRTKIVSEVETLIAKYRKCLNVAVQGKKLFQMELEKIHHAQRGKLRKLRETNKQLESEMSKLRKSAAATSTVTSRDDDEQSESQISVNSSMNLSSPKSAAATERTEESTDDVSEQQRITTTDDLQQGERDDQASMDDQDMQEASAVVTSSALPRLSPDSLAEPLDK